MSQNKSDPIAVSPKLEETQVEPLSHAQLKEQLAVLVQGCKAIETHLMAGQLGLPAKEFAQMQNALMQLKKSNIPHKEKRSKSAATSAVPVVKLGSFIRNRLLK